MDVFDWKSKGYLQYRRTYEVRTDSSERRGWRISGNQHCKWVWVLDGGVNKRGGNCGEREG